MCVWDFEKLNWIWRFDLSIFANAQAAWKDNSQFKSVQKWLQTNNLVSLISIKYKSLIHIVDTLKHLFVGLTNCLCYVICLASVLLAVKTTRFLFYNHFANWFEAVEKVKLRTVLRLLLLLQTEEEGEW